MTTRRRALGPQGVAALLRIVHPEPAAPRRRPTPASAGPSFGRPTDVGRLEAQVLRRRLADAEERIRELEHELRLADARTAAARRDGERALTAQAARTLGGRVPSILETR